MKKIGGYTILSKKEVEKIFMAMISSEARMTVIRDDMYCGQLVCPEVTLITGEPYRFPIEYFIDSLDKEIQNSKEARKDLY